MGCVLCNLIQMSVEQEPFPSASARLDFENELAGDIAQNHPELVKKIVECLGRRSAGASIDKEANMKVIDSMWFNTNQGHFGLVVGENSMGERKLYGGVVSGLDQKADEKAILDWGNKANIGMMEGLIAKTKACTKENPCCDRRGEYNGYGQEPLKSCPTKCICHRV